ncbi:hypothetical protein F7725_006222 [Dissostichus mawsoni]|uniref:Uncharacterized protein n=1 Tax=Dissostichus mawsoni TaxID=36200 RepID=A0A7J5YWH9_DISMA|nr:hypothetical protein F7725_006222 [Dissostichus mawsoni]
MACTRHDDTLPYLVRRAQENQTVLQEICKERDLPAGGSADTGIARPPSPANSSGHPPSHPNHGSPRQNTLRGPGHPLPSPLLPNPPLLPTPSTQQLPLSQRTPRLRFSTRNPTSSKPTSPITSDTTIPATSDQNPILPRTTLSRTSSLHQHSPLLSNSFCRGAPPLFHAPRHDREELQRDLHQYHRRLKIIDYFHTKPCSQHSLFTFPSNWEPLITQALVSAGDAELLMQGSRTQRKQQEEGRREKRGMQTDG